MIEEQATVVRATASIAWVEAVRRSSCGGCSAAAGCGTSLLDRFLGRRPLRLEVENNLDVATGDRVIVGVPEGSMLRAAAAAYLGPLVGLILGAILGRHLPLPLPLPWMLSSAPAGIQPLQPELLIGPELLSLAGGALGFVLALWLVARYSRSLARDPRFRPVLLRREPPVTVSLSLG